MTSKFLRALDLWIPTISSKAELSDVPEILARRGGEFCATSDMGVETVASACRNGFLPMGLSHPLSPLLLVKLHVQRCVLFFDRIHMSRSTKRHARGLTMTIDNDFQSVLRTLMATYDDQWLIPQLADAFNRLRERPLNGVRTHSVEVYDGENLVAGEIGYSVGPVYTSLSGFHRKDGAGTVQLVMLANVLKEAQFLFWDLGMEAEYKMRLGATLIEREAFLSLYRRSTRDETNSHPLPRGPWSCREYLDQPVGRDKI